MPPTPTPLSPTRWLRPLIQPLRRPLLWVMARVGALRRGVLSQDDRLPPHAPDLPGLERATQQIWKAFHPSTVHTLTSDESQRLLCEARCLLHRYRTTYSLKTCTPFIQENADRRMMVAQYLLRTAECLLCTPVKMGTSILSPPIQRVLRCLIVLFSTTADEIFPLNDLLEDLKHVTPPQPAKVKALQLYGEVMHAACVQGIPQAWVPLFRTFKKQDVVKVREDEPVPPLVLKKLCDDTINAFLEHASHSAMPLSARVRHIQIMAHELPEAFTLFCKKSEIHALGGFKKRFQVMQPLSEAPTASVYHAWLTTWLKRGFPFDARDLWNITKHPHKLVSAYACLFTHFPNALSESIVHLIVRGPPDALFPLPPSSPSSPDSHHTTCSYSDVNITMGGIDVAGYVLPLLYEGEQFLRETGVEAAAFHTLAPIINNAFYHTVEEGVFPSLPSCRLWSPWQHLGAYLTIELSGGVESQCVSKILEERLSLFERLWGPPCTPEGGVDAFYAWYQQIVPLAFPYTTKQSADQVRAQYLWHRFLDTHVLRHTLTQEASPHTLGDAVEEANVPALTLKKSSPRRRL